MFCANFVSWSLARPHEHVHCVRQACSRDKARLDLSMRWVERGVRGGGGGVAKPRCCTVRDFAIPLNVFPQHVLPKLETISTKGSPARATHWQHWATLATLLLRQAVFPLQAMAGLPSHPPINLLHITRSHSRHATFRACPRRPSCKDALVRPHNPASCHRVITTLPTRAYTLKLQHALINGSRTGPPWATGSCQGRRGKASQTQTPFKVHSGTRKAGKPAAQLQRLISCSEQV